MPRSRKDPYLMSIMHLFMKPRVENRIVLLRDIEEQLLQGDSMKIYPVSTSGHEHQNLRAREKLNSMV